MANREYETKFSNYESKNISVTATVIEIQILVNSSAFKVTKDCLHGANGPYHSSENMFNFLQ